MDLQFTLAGANFRPAETKQFIREQMTEAAVIELEREPSNAYDANAIRVNAEGIFIGYVPKSDNAVLAAHLDNDGDYEISCIGFAGALKPVFEVSFEPDEFA